MTDEIARRLSKFVHKGGTLIIGCRAGYKDEHGKCPMLPQPGLLAELTGTDVRDFTLCSPDEPEIFARMEQTCMPAPVFNDVLTLTNGARVLARYTGSYYEGSAALVENRVGSGRVLHWGSVFSEETALALLKAAGVHSPFADLVDAPEGVELVSRARGERRFLFALNWQGCEATVVLKRGVTNLDTGAPEAGTVVLPVYGTAVYDCTASYEGSENK